MTKDEAMRLALEVLESDPLDIVLNPDGHMGFRKDQAITALRAALDEPVQESINYADWNYNPMTGEPIWDAPPRREWAGLTDEEIWSDGDSFVTSETGIKQFARAIEARLKEKNCGS